jgi:fructokinase
VTRPQLEFVGIGEVLLDLFDDGHESLGGAPLNAAVHCHRLLRALDLGRAVVVSALGDDDRGRYIRATLAAESFPTDYLGASRLPTGWSDVFVRGGEPGFEIAQNVAWDDIPNSPAIDALAERCSAVCFGSLAQRAARSRETIQSFLRRARQALILYDVNLRTSTRSGARGFSREIIEQSCRSAVVMKANAQEILELAEVFAIPGVSSGEDRMWHSMDFFLREFPLNAVVVTRGAQSTFLLSRDENIVMPSASPRDAEIHPVGAGDAFSAGLLFGMSQRWPWRTSLELAAKMGTWVAYSPSDIPPLPTEVIEFAKSRLPRRE